jgi:hypothetical protein
LASPPVQLSPEERARREKEEEAMEARILEEIRTTEKSRRKAYNKKVKLAKQASKEADALEKQAAEQDAAAAEKRRRASKKRKEAGTLRNEAAVLVHDQPEILQQHRFLTNWELETARASRLMGGPSTPLPAPPPQAIGLSLPRHLQTLTITDETQPPRPRQDSPRRRAPTTAEKRPQTPEPDCLPGWPPKNPPGSTKHTPTYIHSRRQQHVPINEVIVEAAVQRANRLLDVKIKGSGVREKMASLFEATTQGLQYKTPLSELARNLPSADHAGITEGKEAYLLMLEELKPEDPTFRFLLPADIGCVAMFKEKQALHYAQWLVSHAPGILATYGKARVITALAHMLAVSVVSLDALIKV